MNKLMAGLLIALLAVTLVAVAAPGRYDFAIAVRSDLYASSQAKIQIILLEIWQLPDTAENKTWADSGWQDYREIAATNTQWKVYHVSMKQILESSSDANIAKWEAQMANNPQFKLSRTTDFKGLMETYGIEPVPAEGP